jgi:hypothetical protein
MVEWNCLMWPVQLALFGGELFAKQAPSIDAAPLPIAFVFLVVGGVVIVWSTIVTLKTFAEVHGFSAWKAAAVTIFMMTPFIAAVLAYVAIVATVGR